MSIEILTENKIAKNTNTISSNNRTRTQIVKITTSSLTTTAAQIGSSIKPMVTTKMTTPTHDYNKWALPQEER